MNIWAHSSEGNFAKRITVNGNSRLQDIEKAYHQHGGSPCFRAQQPFELVERNPSPNESYKLATGKLTGDQSKRSRAFYEIQLMASYKYAFCRTQSV